MGEKFHVARLCCRGYLIVYCRAFLLLLQPRIARALCARRRRDLEPARQLLHARGYLFLRAAGYGVNPFRRYARLCELCGLDSLQSERCQLGAEILQSLVLLSERDL